jgi:regulator of sigma E protease
LLFTFNVDKKYILVTIGIAKISGSSLDQWLYSVLFLMAVLSINLGLINLLPIPVLDGGYLVLFMYELIFKKPLSSSIQIFLLKFGFIFLVSLMLLVTAFDLGF